MEKIKKAAIYIRRGEDDGKTKIYTTKNQKRKLFQMCKELGYDVHKIYCDEWNNGFDFNREGLTELLNDLDENKFNCIVCYGKQRLMGGLFNVEPLFEILNNHNCKVETYLSYTKNKQLANE